MKLNLTIYNDVLANHRTIMVLINKMQQADGHLDEPDRVKLQDAELKMKYVAKMYPEEWSYFQQHKPTSLMG